MKFLRHTAGYSFIRPQKKWRYFRRT